MNTRRLLVWGDIDESRRRAARGGLAGLSPWLYSAVAGLVLAAAVARGMGALGGGQGAVATASSLWLAALAAGQVIVVFGAPFRLFWRRDAALLGRLPVPGRPLFLLALARSVRAAIKVFVPCAVAAAAFALGPAGAPELVLRHMLMAVIAALVAGLLGPSAALGAGAIVASDKAQAVLDNLGGEFHAPKTSWLGLLPGLTGTALALLLMAAAPWARGAETTAVGGPVPLLVVAAAVPIAAALWAAARAHEVMLPALREVAALDQERLAHVELVTPSRLERLVGNRLLGGTSSANGAALVFAKDAMLARRRYPIPFFLGFLGLVGLGGIAAVAPGDMLVWASVISAGLGGYGVVMARRLMSPPIEHVGFLQTLPVGGRGATRAKRMRVLLWTGCYTAPGAAAVVARSEAPVLAALVLGGIALASVVAGIAALRGGRASAA